MARESQFAKDVRDRYLEEYPPEEFNRIKDKLESCDFLSEDPRMTGKCTFLLSEIFLVIFTATLCGITSFRGMEVFGENELEWLRFYLPFANGIPSHDTIRRVCNMMKPTEVMAYCQALLADLKQVKAGKHISIDGKAIQGYFETPGNRLVLSVSAYCVEGGISLSQVITHNELGKEEGEYQATIKLLDLLELQGKVITADAGMCHRVIIDKITQHQADYIVALKNNQPKLYQATVKFFEKTTAVELQKYPSIHEENQGHGRKEERTCSIASAEDVIPAGIRFPGQKSIIKLESIRLIGGKESKQTRYYISSLPPESLEEIFPLIRSHWSIENKLHYVLDVTFKEDATRSRDRYGVENLLLFRRLVISLINQVKGKGTMPLTMLKATLNKNFRTYILDHL